MKIKVRIVYATGGFLHTKNAVALFSKTRTHVTHPALCFCLNGGAFSWRLGWVYNFEMNKKTQAGCFLQALWRNIKMPNTTTGSNAILINCYLGQLLLWVAANW